MRLIAALMITAATLSPGTSAAQAASAPLSVRDGSQKKDMVIALDEVYLPGADELKSIPVQASLETLKTFARDFFLTTRDEPQVVLYLAGAPRSEATRRIATNRIILRTNGTLGQAQLAMIEGVTAVTALEEAPDTFVLEILHPASALVLAQSLSLRDGVLDCQPELARQQQSRAIPNDSYFSSQWHLRNTGQNAGAVAGVDVNVVGVWDTFKGQGVDIGIVDNGVQTGHPDLSMNYKPALSYDFNAGTATPTLTLTRDKHGTSCAGLAAGRGFNGAGISGTAPLAGLVNLRLTAKATTDSIESKGLGYKTQDVEIKSNSWGPDDGRGADGPGPLTVSALKSAAQSGRGGKGTIFVWAGGNGRNVGDNSNLDGYANSVFTIAVGAADDRGRQTYYSESGANLIVCAPSSNSARPGIVSTDLVGASGYNTGRQSRELSNRDYTNTFGGTSAATPMVAGICALMIEARPDLAVRDVQEILLRTGQKVSPSDSGWTTNSAGFTHNEKFGSGLVDARAAVNKAVSWNLLPTVQETTVTASGLPMNVPDNNATGVTLSIPVSLTLDRVEQVVVEFSAKHAYRGDLEVTLTSPTGIVSLLAPKNSDSGNDYDAFRFMTVRDWGENPDGTWKVKIADRARDDAGKVTAVKLIFRGTTGLPANYND